MVDDIRPDMGPKNKNDFSLSEPPTPEDLGEISKDDIISDDTGSVPGSDKEPSKPDKKRLHHKITELGMKLWPSSRKQWIIGIIIVILLIGAGTVAAQTIQKQLNKRDKPAPVAAAKKEPPKTTEPSKISGVEISKDINKRPVYSIQIENSPDARPQSGLRDASVIFEAIAEGGITRFNASFLDNQPDYIGPVRSVRPYYVDLVAPFDPIFVHAGGSADGLAELRNVGLKDLDHGANASAFTRIKERYAPHNLYTSTAALDQASQARGYTSSNAVGFARKAKDTPSATPNAKSIDFNLSGFLYNPHFDYDAPSNTYVRSQAGKPHTDLRSGATLTPKVVVAVVTDYSTRGIYSVYRMNGTGKVYVFQDGIVTEGTWTKNAAREQLVFTDPAGKPIKLNPGQTWVTLVGGADRVSFKP